MLILIFILTNFTQGFENLGNIPGDTCEVFISQMLGDAIFDGMIIGGGTTSPMFYNQVKRSHKPSKDTSNCFETPIAFLMYQKTSGVQWTEFFDSH